MRTVRVVAALVEGIGLRVSDEIAGLGASFLRCSSDHPNLLIQPGPIAFVHDGDRIKIDVPTLSLDLLVDDAELERRAAEWPGPPAPRYTTGVLAKYAKLAQGAERGAITNIT